MMKKYAVALLALLLAFSRCAPFSLAENKKTQIAATIFPLFDWAREIAGEDAEVTLLMSTGVDLHSFQPSVQDIMTISAADLFIFVGGESDDWVEDVIRTARNPDLVTIHLLEVLGDRAKEEETVEGMETEEDEEEEAELDEHVWLSLRNAQHFCLAIANTLAEIDPDNAEAYQTRADAYIARLSALDAEYAKAVESAEYKTLLFGDRFPFRYLADDYGLDYYAAFSGCHAEAEASFQTIFFLAEKMDALHLPAVLTIENPKTRIAETVVSATRERNQKILALDSMQSTTLWDVQAGASYLRVMEENLDVLREALHSQGE